MKTADLIDALATGAGAAPRAVAARRLAPAMAAGLLLSSALAIMALGLAPAASQLSLALWIKLGYMGTLGLAAAWLTARLSRPAARSGAAWAAIGVVVAIMALVGIGSALSVAPGERAAYALGRTWALCPWAVLVLSLPALAAALWAVRGLAPTRPRVAGGAAGLVAGSVGALGYAFACFEESTAFIALWYTLGIVLTGALGAALGPRMLRW